MIFRNARIVTLDSANRLIDSGAVQVCADGTIGYVGTNPPSANGELVIDGRGKLLMPALINCHTHLYSTLARGLTLAGHAPENFPQILKKLWWRLDAALDEKDIYYSALAGLIDSAKAGVGTILDHHSSPNACSGSLDIIERAVREVGLRAALCYETSDRHGAAKTTLAINENARFIGKTTGAQNDTVGASFGLHASFTLSDRTLRRCVEANQALRAGFHIHIAEDTSDVADARSRFHKTPVKRLCDLGVLDNKAVAAHCVHVTAADRAALARHGINVVHNPQSNCNNAVGQANVPALMQAAVLVGLGSDGYSPRLWEEFLAASHLPKLRTRDPRNGVAEAYTLALLNNRQIVKKIWGWELGRIETGARADLILVDYYPPTPLATENLIGHILFGIAHAAVDSLVVNGRLIVREHECVTVDERTIAERAAAQAHQLWQRL